MPPPAVEVDGLVKRYGGTTAVDGLSMTVERGTITAILGPNGAGKTTTIEICEGYRRADAGRLRVLGLDPATSGRELRPRIGVMLQSGGVYPGARVREMVALVGRLHAHPLPTDYVLDRVGLTDAARVTYRRLSGGQRQRLGLGLALVGRPELVFLDEPTAGLDPAGRRSTWALLEELRADGVTVVLATHYMEEAERLADAIVVIDRGRQVAAGTPAELTRGGAEGQLRFRAPSGLDIDQLLAALPVGSAAKESPAGHYLVEGDIDAHLLAAVTAWCASHGVLPEELKVEQRSLEDVFLELTGRELG